MRDVRMRMRFGLTLAAMAAATALGGSPAPAQQGLFAPVATVDGMAINRYQAEQRARFLALLRAPDATFDGARDVLIEEVLQVGAARAAGVEVTPDELDEGMVEFAARANLQPDQFLAVLGQNGIDPETFRDFIRNGLYWRKLVQSRFGPRARPSEAEIERALTQGSTTSGSRALLSEIAIPLTPATQEEALRVAQRLSDTITSADAFQQAARRFSRAPSAARGGRLDWVPVFELAPPIASEVLGLAPGQVSDPVNLGSFVGIFLLRDLDEGTPVRAETLSIDYAEVRLPGDGAATAAARIDARADTCGDLYGVAPSGPDRLVREVRDIGALPDDLRQTFAALDEGETAVLQGPGYLRLIMLCGRVTEIDEGAFDRVGTQMLNQRLVGYADGYLSELEADAVIERF